jgi:acylphosphatase
MNDEVIRCLVIAGRVQGVGFRYALQAEATRLRLTGWVRNRRDGTVEAVVAGAAGAVEALVAWAHHGPPAARVSRVTVTPGDGRYEGFELRPTA